MILYITLTLNINLKKIVNLKHIRQPKLKISTSLFIQESAVKNIKLQHKSRKI